MHVIELQKVQKYFGSLAAVDDLSLSIPSGSVYGFIGPNGSGKTTTLRMIMNIIHPDSGTIRVFGSELQKLHTDRIGYMPEERGIYTRMKVGELLEFYGGLKNGRNLKDKVKYWLHKMELSDWIDKKVETLSKGMTQKIQFIATIIAEPELIILDEPFSGLDPVNRDVIRDAVLELQSAGATVIFSTHDMAVAEKMCDRIFMIYKGKKVLDGSLDQIRESYGTDTVRLRSSLRSSDLNSLPGIRQVNDFGREFDLRLHPGTDPQSILHEVLRHGTVSAFEIVSPSLHDIFKRIARPESDTDSAGAGTEKSMVSTPSPAHPGPDTMQPAVETVEKEAHRG